MYEPFYCTPTHTHALTHARAQTRTCTREGGIPHISLSLFFIHYHGHTVGQLGPVCVQPAAPAGGEAGEEPGLLFPRPVTSAFLLPLLAVARLLQANIPHQVSPESGTPGLLDVQKHDHVVAFNVELHVSVQVSLGEVEFGRCSGGAVVLQVLISVEIVAVLESRGGK